ncbi:M1 family metallopeptidase [Phanerochaete sordida]|uniref:Aminopeptidase n=1 Tax=Phanerochaete sordida TaxID=48140 RepID=A0A9P3GM93_9APHY|nr:M1 family metallopeptidase [Phanerochaete sordida]
MAGPISEATKPADQYRLPTNVRPTHYDLTVRTDLEKLKFDGYVTVHLDVVRDTKSIQFNTAKLKLGHAKLASSSLSEPFVQEASSLKYDDEEERATLDLPMTLPAGTKAELKIDFEGELTGAMMGYYRSAWEHEGKTAHYSLTQFEPTAARRAFPCWDEPALKATFSITMVSRADTVNLANMPAVSEHVYEPSLKESTDVVSWLSSKVSALTTGEADKWKITKFEKTPPMSTYIVAWANGPFAHLESSYTSPLSGAVRPLRVYTTPDLIHQAQFALDVKRQVLPLYERVFDIEYPLPKLDTLVATDFDAGAMENWGLITGRTSAFLLDPAKADLNGKKNVAATQSHEVAHMWFGNITTMEWWDNLYLNEGFASLVGETIILDKVFPEWKLHSAFISGDLNAAMSLDAKLSSHPIEVDTPDANMANQIFDALSYDKAASVLRMLSRYVTEEKFLKGVSIYLKKFLYKNTVTKDLWQGIAEASGLDVPKVMDNWVKKMGFPVVKVTEVEGGIRVRQDRFLETGPADPKDNETIWSIPLSLLTVDSNGKSSIDNTILLDEREKFIALDTSKPFKLNAGTVSVFRVLYSPERLVKIAEEAAKENSVFSLEDRIGLVWDALALSKAGYMEVSSALKLYEAFRNEKEYLVWNSISQSLSALASTWFEDADILKKLDAFRRELFVPIVKRLGFDYPEDEHVDVRQLRTTAIVQSADSGDEFVVAELIKRFNQAVETGDDSCIPPDLMTVIYRTAVTKGGRKEYDAVTSIVAKPKTPQMGIAGMRAMGASHDKALLEETWDYIMTKSRDQNLFYLFAGLQENFAGRHFLVRKFEENYDALYNRLIDNFGMQILIRYTFNGLASEKDHDDAKAFFEGKDTSKYSMALAQALDTIKSRAAWIQRSSNDLREWLSNRA